MNAVYTFLLGCFNFSVSAAFKVVEFFRILKIEIFDFALSSGGNQLAKSKKVIADFDKKPEHLGVILNESVSVDDIARIVAWCSAIKVPYVSIYDISGCVKSNIKALYQAITAQTLEKNSLKFTLLNNSSAKIIGNNNHNGLINHVGETHLSFLTSSDGKGDIANAAKKICQDIADGNVEPSEVTTSLIDEHLHALKGFPDPQTIICFGRGQSLCGYLPWHIRLSEIVFFETHNKFHFKDFFTVLEIFNHCEQRFGK